MAEGFLRHHAEDSFEAFSGSARAGELNPAAVEVMREVGIDISGHSSKDGAEFLGRNFHFIIGVCDKVKEICPVLPGAIWYLEWSLEDPASGNGSPSECVTVFQRIRDEIVGHVLDFIAKKS